MITLLTNIYIISMIISFKGMAEWCFRSGIKMNRMMYWLAILPFTNTFVAIAYIVLERQK